MAIGGYHNRIARINLTTGKVSYEPLNEEWVRKYIGARGLGVRYVFEAGPTVQPFSEENLLCIMLGPLTGTEAKMSGRLAVVTKSPLTGTVVDSHMGGWTAAKLKWAGFDGLIFEGRSNKPVYAYVENGEVTLKDASDIWGLGVHETVRAMRIRHGEDVAVMSIGPAGENLVRFANFVNEDDRASGRGGTGAVAGWKRLKCIVIKPNKDLQPKPPDREKWKAADKKALATIMDEANITSPRKGGLSVYGTNVLMNIVGAMGALPSWNSKLTSFMRNGTALYEAISGERIKETILVNDPTCHACPVACKKEVEVKEGKYKVHMESTEYESMWALGANCGTDNAAAIALMIYYANDYGLDTIELGNVLSMFMEATERGVFNGEGLAWGDADGQLETIRKLTYRVGIGDVLAEGTWHAAKSFGVPELAMSVKGQAIPAYDPRGLKGMGIAYATSNRGACHLRAYTPASEILGIPYKTDPLEWKGKGELTKLLQDVHAVSDSFNICKFSAFAEGVEEYLEQFNAMTGLDYTAEELLRCGERIYNLERYYNNLAGFREGSDYLPERFLKEPSTMPGSEGHVCELDLMLEEYYKARGWENGVVPKEKLEELGIP